MPKAVIFDVDGTLVDSVDLHAKSWQDAFGEYGRDIPFDDIRMQIGKGGDQLMPVFLSEDDIEAFGEELEERRGAILKERYLPKVEAFPGVRDLLEHLQAQGLRIALASSAKEDELETYKEAADIEDLVDVQTSSDDADNSKPRPDIFLAALEKLGDPRAEDVIVVGDTPYDAEAASQAGLRTIGLLCGGFPEDSLWEAGCIAVYRDPADLLAQYDSSPLSDDEEPASCTGCTLATATPPQVEVAGVELRGIGLFDQTLGVTLCVTNPNTSELAFRRIQVAVDAAGIRWRRA